MNNTIKLCAVSQAHHWGEDVCSHILLVEDDIEVAEITREVLVEEGYDVSWVRDGSEALRFLEGDKTPRLILLDLMMPQMSGWQFMQELVKLPIYKSISVVIVSAGRDVEPIASQLGVQGFLVKPFDVEKLLGVVRRHCGSSA